MFRPIKALIELDYERLTMNQAMRIFTTRKNYLVLAPNGGFHLTNQPQRLVMENYKIEDAYDIEVYEL